MDCRACQPMLLDLAHGELTPELSAVVREHVEGCASCRAALQNLKAAVHSAEQMPWLEPPAALRVNVMALAEQHAKQRAMAAEAIKSRSLRPEGFAQSVLDFLGRLAAGRQVAMATIMMLIVAVGVWSLPELDRLPSGQGITVVSPDPEGEAAPSGGLAPAEPLDLTVDQRSRRIRSREELAEQAYRPQAPVAAMQLKEEADPLAEPELEVPATLAQPSVASADDKADKNELDLDNLDSVIEAKPLSEGQLQAMGDVTADEKLGGGKGSTRLRRAKSAPEPFPKSAEASVRKDEAERAAGPSTIDDLLDGALASGSGSRSNAQAAPAPAPEPLKKAKSKSAEKPAAQAADIEEESTAKSATALAKARSIRASQGCSAALSAYADAVKDPLTTGTALIELALCQRELGRESAARATLERARSVSSVASRAQKLLDETAAPKAASPTAVEAASSPARD